MLMEMRFLFAVTEMFWNYTVETAALHGGTYTTEMNTLKCVFYVI